MEISDADLLEKTFSTLHASNLLLQQQYRERRFRKYSELILCLLVIEKNNELLLRNHQSHLTVYRGGQNRVRVNPIGFRVVRVRQESIRT